ncbi:MAG TPA: O-antigen ligase family protein [Legionellaceae bacterium]|nr:O-antigen ligase family protein [Legionellaceae bacterium]
MLNKRYLLFNIPISRPSLKSYVLLFLVASLFFLPISSTGKSIFVTLSLITILLIPEYRTDLKTCFSLPWYQALLLFFAMILVACLWSPADIHTKWVVIEKYSKLLYLPILITGFRSSSTRMWGLHAFLLAALITALLSILKAHGFLEQFNIDPDQVFRNHIIAGLISAFAAYLSLWFYQQTAFSQQLDFQQDANEQADDNRVCNNASSCSPATTANAKHRSGKKWGYLLLSVIYSYHVLFINNGRTGYVIFIGLMLLLALQIFSLKHAVLGILCIMGVTIVLFFQSPVMKAGLGAVYEDLTKYQQTDKNTAVGFRLQFHEFAHHLFNQHPIFGTGTGGFYYHFKQDNPVPVWGPVLLDPHSQYWLIAAELGLLGMGIFLLFIFRLIQACLALQHTKPIALGILFAILLGGFSDSLIFYSSAGYFFILMIALALSETPNKRVKTSA